MCIGARDDRATRLVGEVAEARIYDTALTDPVRQEIEAELRTKWATP